MSRLWNLHKIERALLFLTVLLLPTQLGKHFFEDFSFVYSLPIDYLSPTVYLWDILVLFLIICLILRNGKINKLSLNLFFFFILTQSLSLLSAFANIGVGLVRLEQYLIAGLFGVYIASLKDLKLKEVILPALSFAVIFEAILGILQFLKGSTIGFWILGERTFSLSTPGIAKFDYYGREFLRPYATFPHPNVLAAFMLICAILINTNQDFWKLPNLKNQKLINILSSVTILLTVSRVALISGIAFVITHYHKNRERILLIVGLILLLPILYTRFDSLLNFDNLTFVRREELSFTALKVWSLSPLLGIGLNNFIPEAADLLLAGPSRFLQPVHDIFLLTLSETGIVGLTGLFLLIGLPIYKIFKSKKEFLNIYPGMLIWLTIVFLSLFDHYFLTLPQGYRLLFLVWGLTLGLLQ